MKKAWMLLALLLAGPAIAQESDGQRAVGVQGDAPRGEVVGGITADTLYRVIRLDANGNLLLTDANPDRDQYWVHPLIMNNAGVQEDNSDSTQFTLDTRGWKYMALAFYPRVDADSVWAALIAIRVQGHTIATYDTSAAYPWYRPKLGTTNSTAPGTTADTLGSFTDPGTSVASSFDPRTSDFLVVVKVRPGVNQPQGMWLPLYDSRSGGWFNAPYTTIKATVVETYDASGAARAAGPLVRWRAELVGWR